jgi:hypothetical protein
MNSLDRIDRVSQKRLALRLRRSHGDCTDASMQVDKRLTAELDELWHDHRTGLAAKHIPRPLGTPR